MHPPNDPQFVNLITRSRDRGRSWEDPRVAPGYDWFGVETPGIAQIMAGPVLLDQWRFRWYPLETARRRADDGDEIFVLDTTKFQWVPALTEDDWRRHPWPYARADGGAFVHRSTDRGATWEEPIALDITPYQAAFSPRGVIELSNGELLMTLGSHDHDPSGASIALRSYDGGLSWTPPVEVAREAGKLFSEPGAVECSDGTVLVFSREEMTGCAHVSESRDGGITWMMPRALELWGYPQHVIRLADERLLMVYGRRKEPAGIRGSLSSDHGRTWSEEFVIRDHLRDSFFGMHLGYPSVIEYAPGALFCVYYAEGDDGITCIQGTAFTIEEVDP